MQDLPEHVHSLKNHHSFSKLNTAQSTNQDLFALYPTTITSQRHLPLSSPPLYNLQHLPAQITYINIVQV